MQKLTFFRLIAQVASFILAISLRNISEEVLGTYAISLSILSVLSAVITYEGTFLVISRNISGPLMSFGDDKSVPSVSL